MKLALRSVAILAFTAALGLTTSAAATQWNDRTLLKFSDPVIVPGATLQPGSYVFKLVDSESNRNLVEIRKEGSNEVVTITQAIPTKRTDAKGDVVLKMNPTDYGTPPAIQAWFYPGSLYGHRFVYPDKQAKDIAQRTKTIVLSTDVEGSDLSRGTLYTYDASGNRGTWQNDEAVNREWQEWRKSSAAAANATAQVHTPGAPERRDSTAPMIQGDQSAMKVPLDKLEENKQQYIGKTVSVDGEVEEILGPRIFTIDEPDWGDLDGELLVFMPTNLVALVQDDDMVTVTGTVKPFVRADFEKEWGWFDPTPELEAKLALKPVLVASRIVGGNSNMALEIESTREAAGQAAVGTAGTAKPKAGGSTRPRGEALASLDDVADADRDMIGRHLEIDGAKVTATAKDGRGFFVRSSQGTSIFVLPAHEQASSVTVGSSVSLQGVILQMPDRMEDRLSPSGDWNDDIYVLATNIK